MSAAEFDLVVVGGGPGGYAAALQAGAAGLRVALVEEDKVGGTCLHRGCIPAKHLLETAAVLRTVAGSKEFGIETDQPRLAFGTSQARKQQVVDRLWAGLSGLLKRRDVAIIEGSGSFHGPRTVAVRHGDGSVSEVGGKSIVLATGSAPRPLVGFDADGRSVLTSDHVLRLERLPASVAVIGGGAIGCEFASMLSDLGAAVTLLEVLPSLLPGSDADIGRAVGRSFGRRGIRVRTGTAVEGCTTHADGRVAVQLTEGEEVVVDAVIVAIGRRPRSEGLGLERTAVQVDHQGFVRVDEHLRTAETGVYAVGDVVAIPGRTHPQLAHVAFAEGIHVVAHLLGENPPPIDYGKVPWCVYSHPEVAFVGLSEAAAEQAGHDVVVQRMPFAHNGRALIVGDPDGFVKIVAERLYGGGVGRILGVHMVGPWVTEQLGQALLAVNWEATPQQAARFVQPHPSLSEQFGEAILALTGRGLHS